MADIDITSRKRQLDAEDDYGEGQDDFDSGSACPPRRGVKAARRVSGVLREIRALESIGKNASVMEKVFEKMSLKEVMLWAGCVNSNWYITACHAFRKRYQDSPFLRLWNAQKPSRYLWMEWQLHFHEQLLAGTDEDVEMDGKALTKNTFPPVESIITVGSRMSVDQFHDEDARLPFRENFVWVTCGHAIMTTPDFSYTGLMDDCFSWGSLTIQSLFIPKSEHISLQAFTLGSLNEDVDVNSTLVKSKIEFPQEDVGDGKQLKAVFTINYVHKGGTLSFLDTIRANYKGVALMSGVGEEFGCSRGSAEDPWTVGYSIYAGPNAQVSVYNIDFELQESAEQVLSEMEKQAGAHANGFCFVFTFDNRDYITLKEETDEEEWLSSIRQPSRTNEILTEVKKRMPKIPILGIDSTPSIITEFVNPEKTNVPVDAEPKLNFAFLLITYP